MKNIFLIILILNSITLASDIPDKIILNRGGNIDSPLEKVVELVLTEAYSELGIEVEVRIVPHTRSLLESSEGITDGELFRIASIEDKYPTLMRVLVPIFTIEGMAFVSDLEFTVDGWNSIKAYKIGILRGVKYSEIGTVGMNVIQASSYEHLFRVLLHGNVDIVVSSRINGMGAIDKMGIREIHPLEPPLVKIELFHYLNVKNRELIPLITKVLINMSKSGRIAEIKNNFINVK